MRRYDLPTIQCPTCGNSLPPKVLKCHFCGGDLAFVGRPEEPKTEYQLRTPEEIRHDKLYRVVAYWWVFDGFCAMLVGLHLLPTWASGLGGILFSYLGAALTTGFLITVLGVGMLMRLPLARWLVGAFCWFRLVMGIAGVGIVFRSGDYDLSKHNLSVLIILNFFDVMFSAFQLWLLYETDYEVLN